MRIDSSIMMKRIDTAWGIIKTGPRRGDAAEMCIIELVGNEEAAEDKKAKKKAE